MGESIRRMGKVRRADRHDVADGVAAWMMLALGSGAAVGLVAVRPAWVVTMGALRLFNPLCGTFRKH